MNSPETNRALGCDVSHLHPILDFATVGASCSIVCVKATEGVSFVDPKLDYHRKGLLVELPLLVYYHFARSGDPRQQAEFFVNSVRRSGPLRVNERFALDLEVMPAASSMVLGWVQEFYKELFDLLDEDGTRRQHFVYTSARIWEQFGNPDWTADFAYRDRLALWAPRYNVEPHYPLKPAPWAKRGWQIWQWSDGVDPPGATHRVPGIGVCDLNVWNGTIANLQQWMADQETPAVISSAPISSNSPVFQLKTMASGLTDLDLESLKKHILSEQESRAKSAKT